MKKKIEHEPQNEKELVETRGFIEKCMEMKDQNMAVFKEVGRHFELLDKYSYMYNYDDIDFYWFILVQPTAIQAAKAEGDRCVAEKNEEFSQRLDEEKSSFLKRIATFQQAFEKITEYKSYDMTGQFEQESHNLE